MKTSTAFAILTLLAAGSGAVPISRRDGPDCPCEVLDPNNAGDNLQKAGDGGNTLLGGMNNQAEDSPLGDAADKLLGSDSAEDPSSVMQEDDKDVTVQVPHGAAADEATEDAEPITSGDALDPVDEGDAFNGGGNNAFRLSRPGRPITTNNVEDQPADDAADNNGMDLLSSAGLDEVAKAEDVDGGAREGEKALGAEEPVDNVLPGDKTNDKVDNVTSDESTDDTISTLSSDMPLDNVQDKVEGAAGDKVEDKAKDGESGLGLKEPVDGALPGDKTADKVNNVVDPSSSAQSTDNSPSNDNNGSGLDPILAGNAVNDAVAEHTGHDTNDHLDNAGDRPLGQTIDEAAQHGGGKADDHLDGVNTKPADKVADGVVAGSGPKVVDATNGPLSNAAEGVVPGSGPAVKDAAHGPVSSAADGLVPGTGPKVVDATDGPTHDAAEGIIPGSGPVVKNATDRPAGQSVDKALAGDNQAFDGLKGASLLGGLPTSMSGMPDIDMNVHVKPNNQAEPQQQSTFPLSANSVTGALGSRPAGGLTDSVRPAASGLSGGNLLQALVAPGVLGGTPLADRPLQNTGAPASGIVSPLTNGAGIANIVSGAKGLPIVNTVGQQGQPINTDSIKGMPIVNGLGQPMDTDGFFGGSGKKLLGKVKPTASDTSDDVNETTDSLNNGPDGAADQVTDDLAKENVNACKDCINTAIAPVNSKADDADNLVKSDPLHVEPAVQKPDSQLPVSYQCVTSPVTKMPVYTMPCLTNWGGRVGSDVDVCIAQDQMDFKPVNTIACPEEMQDHLGDDLSLLRREDNDEKWDMLSRGINRYVRLCMVANGL
ncbi:uncharacterized protein MKK02DRAFT_32548 [Dioszegia hungarica]|uniref:Uncharacterized protein n=1 Tax=Dioszegia hungarica TaxID=4972 RepID=A0AA38LVA5_9TREE|nr:uncharacterized protein MKK02DRAFT_32548 [Dioszegia hungarica]KAI9635026.1 hypothetical protein MKK02DRAFT_32548 [Dioszegia hungarica]